MLYICMILTEISETREKLDLLAAKQSKSGAGIGIYLLYYL